MTEERKKYYTVGELLVGLNKLIADGTITNDTCLATDGPDIGGYDSTQRAYAGLTLLEPGSGPVDQCRNIYPTSVDKDFDIREQESIGKFVLYISHFVADEYNDKENDDDVEEDDD